MGTEPSPSLHPPCRTLLLKGEKAARVDVRTLGSLQQAELTRGSTTLREERERKARASFVRMGPTHQPAILTVERADEQGSVALCVEQRGYVAHSPTRCRPKMHRASHASLVAGVLSAHSLLGRLGLSSWPRLTTSSALPRETSGVVERWDPHSPSLRRQ